MENHNSHRNKLGYRVILFPKPYIGHITPMLALGNALHSKGFSITIIQTRFSAPDPTKFPDFTFHYIDDALSKSGFAPLDGVQLISVLNESCMGPFKDCLSRILKDSSEEKDRVCCLIADPLWKFAAAVADGFNLPRIALRTGGVLAFLLYESLPLLHEKGYYPLQEARQEELVKEVPPLKVKDLPLEEHQEILRIMVTETRCYPQGVICNTFKELEGSQLDKLHESLHPIPIFSIGPLHKYSLTSNTSNTCTQNETSITWLNTQAPKSVLYVSFGTLVALRKEHFQEIAWGLAKSKQPFLWAVQPSLVRGWKKKNAPFSADFLAEVAGRSHIVEWVPQRRVLAHPAVAGFWTHCGWNSTIESVCEGVPMLCLPIFGDQKMNARHLCDRLKVGLLLENGIEREEIERGIRKLMVLKEGEEMRERVATLKENTNRCLSEGGSSSESLDRLTNHILSLSCDQNVEDSGA